MKKILSLIAIIQFTIVLVMVIMHTSIAHADTNVNGRWLDYFEEGDSLRQDNGVRVETRTPNEKAGAHLKTGLWTWNFKDSAVSFKVKVSNWSNASIITLLIGNGLKFENAATFDILLRLVGAPNNEWIEVVIPPSAWNIEGVPDFESIDSILFTVADNGIARVTAQISNIKIIPIQKTGAVASITIDDGEVDTLFAADVMKSFGFVGTAFIDPQYIGKIGFMVDTDLQMLSNLGWDISGHRIGKLTALNDDNLKLHAIETSDFLVSNKFNGSNLYALPNGSRNTAISQTMLTKFDYLFNIDGMSNINNAFISSNINRHSIDKHTSLALAKRWVDDAIKNDEWVIINFHTFSDDWAKDEDWSIADFTALLEYLKEKNVPVKPISQIVKR